MISDFFPKIDQIFEFRNYRNFRECPEKNPMQYVGGFSDNFQCSINEAESGFLKLKKISLGMKSKTNFNIRENFESKKTSSNKV